MIPANTRKAPVGVDLLAMDPSVLNLILRAHTLNQEAEEGATRREDRANVPTFPAMSMHEIKPPPGLEPSNASKPFQKISSQASDSTFDPEISETESLSDKSGGDNTEPGNGNYAAPRPVGPVLNIPDEVPSTTGLQSVAAPRVTKGRRQNALRKEANKLILQRRGVKESVAEPLGNSSPDAFAAAWTMAESKQAWKPEDKPGRTPSQKEKGSRANETNAYDARDDHTSAPVVCEDVPLPKWCQPGAPAGIVPTSLEEQCFMSGGRSKKGIKNALLNLAQKGEVQQQAFAGYDGEMLSFRPNGGSFQDLGVHSQIPYEQVTRFCF